MKLRVLAALAALLVLGACAITPGGPCGSLLSTPFSELEAASGSCPSEPPGDDTDPSPEPQSLDPAEACAAAVGDDPCVACAKRSCCEVFVTCFAEHCPTPDPAEQTCLHDHCTKECPAQ